MNRILRVTLLLVLVIALAVLEAWAGSNKADLSRTVFLGDSLTAGFQNGSLLATQQVHGYAAVLAAQAGVELSLPLIAFPGIPNVLTLVDPGPPPVIEPLLGLSPGRLNPGVQPTDLAVPAATVQDALTTRPDCLFDDLTDVILGLPGCFVPILKSQVEWAEALAPIALVIWLGNNDVLLSALFEGTDAFITPVAAFETAYTEVMDRLARPGVTVVVANVPDVTVVPFLTTAEEVLAQVSAATGLPPSLLEFVLGIGPGDFVLPDAFPLITAILTESIPGPLPANVVLDAAEIASIRETTAGYNAIIATKAAEKGAALVDIHGFLESARARGIVVGGQRLTTAFLGGLFSLDGVHPTNTGYAVIANEFIKALNTHFAAGIPPVSIRQVQKSDPLVLPGVGHPASALGHISPETAGALRAVMGR
jgi:phospholipase/lecithinase/hemolysin